MTFRTKIDFSSNRQVKQIEQTSTALNGTTVFGLPINELSSGPKLSTSATTSVTESVISTFTGDETSTTFIFGKPEMNGGEAFLNVINPSSEEDIQIVEPFYIGVNPSVNPHFGNTVYEYYVGCSFDLKVTNLIYTSPTTYSGTLISEEVITYQAESFDYAGDGVWVDVRGKLKTENLIINSLGSGASTRDIGIDDNGNVVEVLSDINLKENIEIIPNALSKVLKLRGVTYNWKDRINGGNDLKLGLIAQEVKKIVPELVTESSDGKFMGVSYGNVTALLIEAIKELASGENVFKNGLTFTETIVAEDNNIELNYNGNHNTALNGGVTVIDGVEDGINSELKVDENGDWEFLPNIKIKKYTPNGSNDVAGNVGNICYDEYYQYIKTTMGWRRTKLENF